MKNKFSFLLVALLTFGFATSTFAQYDDLYVIPSDDNEVTQYQAEEEYVAYEATEAADEYDEYSYLDDQDYYYSSRIRRFNNSRSNSGFGYYSPFFTDAAYYNAAFSPGVSIYAGNPFSYNAARRALRNPFLGGFNSAFSPFYNPFGAVGFGGGFNTFNSFNRFGGASAFNAYCPPTSYGNNLVTTSRGASNAVFGPRGSNSTINSSSRSNDSSVRRGTSRVIRSAQGSDSASSRSRSSSTRANTNARTNSNSRTYDRSSRSNRSNRSYNTRSNNSSRSSATPRRSSSSSSRSFSSPRSSSRSSSIRSSSSSRRQ